MNVFRSLSYPILLALLAVYFAWGGTYLAMRIAVETMPPFLLAGIRFITAGLLLYLWEMLKGTKTPTKYHWRNAAISGGMMLLGGNALVAWAEQTVPSGIAALIVATVPLWMTLFAWLRYGESKPTLHILAGLGLGFLGQILLISNSWNSPGYHTAPLTGYLVLTLAALFWAAGSVYSRKAQLPASSFMSIALQNIAGGGLCLLVGLLAGEPAKLQWASLSLPSLLALAYLIFIGSLIGFSAYIWVLKKAEPSLVSTYAYVNPLVAVFLGYVFADEPLTAHIALAAGIIVLAVILITKTPKPANRPSRSTGCPFSGLDGEGI
ncbi:EamA family transporter [Propionispora hippei]|uniref:Permease of the drug/metabolite transporter (DMT) superfamily n=1 Tax=Propionispora hippei DSM 15287 TaxID=1123003 RepID=A0A1M6H6Q2_9FIRM|nr:EamA family transporter [Propionispora hippei]SHJ17891.1 Permease of the drug/metabolite transporter (DMT) superfamily [Propionispora hippei DSM 15287]